MIEDNQSLIRVYRQRRDGGRWGYSEPFDLRIYDNGFGPLWIYGETLGSFGVVRALTWEESYETVLDEILTPVSQEDISNDPSDYFVCERDYHCAAPKDYAKGLCYCNKAIYSGYRTCWKCRQLVTGHDHTKCKCRDPIDFPPVYLTTAECCYYNSSGEIVETDLNGDSLIELDPELAVKENLTIVLQDEETENYIYWIPETGTYSPVLDWSDE